MFWYFKTCFKSDGNFRTDMQFLFLFYFFYRCREVLDNTVSIIKNSHALSACLIDKDRIVVGTEDGLFCVDLDRDEICRIGDGKKIHQVEYIPDEQLMIVLAGKFLEFLFRFNEKKNSIFSKITKYLSLFRQTTSNETYSSQGIGSTS